MPTLKNNYLLLGLLLGLVQLHPAYTHPPAAKPEILVDQRIQGTIPVSKQALAACFQQKTNTKFLFLPVRRLCYQVGEARFHPTHIQQALEALEAALAVQIAATDHPRHRERRIAQLKAKIAKKKQLLENGNLLMRWGEPPVVYQPDKTEKTTQQLLYYLQGKGYLDAQVTHHVRRHQGNVSVTYQITPHQPYRIRAVQVNTPDAAIAQILQDHQSESLLTVQNLYDQEVLTYERERIYTLLCDQGYFNFAIHHIYFIVDKAAEDHTVGIETRVGLPTNQTAHPVCYLDRIIFSTQEDPPIAHTYQPTIEQGIIFDAASQRYSPHRLVSKLTLRPEQRYSRQGYLETYRRLNQIDLFESIRIIPQLLAPGQITTYLYTIPYPKFALVCEIGCEIHHWLPKPIFNPRLKIRNLLGCLDIIELEAQLGWGGDSTYKHTYNSFYQCRDFSIKGCLSLPQFLPPLPSHIHSYLDYFRPTTKFTLLYHFENQVAYQKKEIVGYCTYTWQKNNTSLYTLTPCSIKFISANIADSTKGKEFKEMLKELTYSPYAQSFKSSFLSNISFSWVWKNAPAIYGPWTQYPGCLTLLLESGGTLHNFFAIHNYIDKPLRYYQYLKCDMAYSQPIHLRPTTTVAYQIKVGIAKPYGISPLLPWEKAYCIGGSHSLRAWKPGGIGPGTYRAAPATLSQTQGYGELLLQGNLEVRQKLIHMIEVALFLDAGNVWMLQPDNRSGSAFRISQFYKEIALGTGIGLRLNFKDLFILCFDLGLVVYDPAQSTQKLFPKEQSTSFNVCIGYPF